MGIITNVGQILKTKFKDAIDKAASGAADVVASTAALSPKQIKEIDEKRQTYLQEMPSNMGGEAEKLTSRCLGAIGVEVFQAYLPQLNQVYKPVDMSGDNFDVKNRIASFDITKWVIDAEENNLDKLVNVYEVLSEEECNVALIYNRSKLKCTVTIAIVNNRGSNDPSKLISYSDRITSAIKGNFPGAELTAINNDTPEVLSDIKNKTVAAISNLPSEKSEKFISQSMEKLLDGIVPEDKSESYTIVLLASPVNSQLEKKNRLYELYSELYPFADWNTNFTYTETTGESSSGVFGLNVGAGAGVGIKTGVGNGSSNDSGNGLSTDIGNGSGVGVGTSDGTGARTGVSGGSYASANFGVNFTRASNVSTQIGKNDGITRNHVNYGIKHTLEIIENQVKRIEESLALGMWDFAAYVISENVVITNNVAHMYMALTQGESSYITQSAINLWGDEKRGSTDAILASLQKLQHPMFCLSDELSGDWYMYPSLVTASVNLTSKELARALNFPRKSVSGLPVIESVAFGREVHKDVRVEDNAGETNINESQINIGKIYHMRHKESADVKLDINSLASHTFITGSTGSGKSNTIYNMLSELGNKNIKFLVVEPAKGEYKEVFGSQENVHVYGTNIKKTPLLRLNPFSFPDDIHVLEHIDRLVEIFNACWPMYAAMPAVLKDAIEQAYVKKGWNLTLSECPFNTYPTFSDLLIELHDVMDKSAYSADTKNDYIGSLVTRVKSLTNGINGQIFCSAFEIENHKLFDENVIADISRVGSMETKALIMGILIMKLQEYRMAEAKGGNEPLKHIIVLEEAHNILRRTSYAQGQESANLQGKSVEMITNSIAEMRTYGEGFIIADQSPGLMDEAVIRNTNTKIIFRLPEEEDRELAGKSAALNENQIDEIAKLPVGVAVIYQNNWLEAVLCHTEVYKNDKDHGYVYNMQNDFNVISKFFEQVFGISEKLDLREEDVDNIKNWIKNIRIGGHVKDILKFAIAGGKLSVSEQRKVAYDLFRGKEMAKILEKTSDENEAINMVDNVITNTYNILNIEVRQRIRNLILEGIFSQENTERLQERYDKVEFRGRCL